MVGMPYLAMLKMGIMACRKALARAALGNPPWLDGSHEMTQNHHQMFVGVVHSMQEVHHFRQNVAKFSVEKKSTRYIIQVTVLTATTTTLTVKLRRTPRPCRRRLRLIAVLA